MTVYNLRRHTIYTTKDNKELKLKEGGRKVIGAKQKCHTQKYFLGFYQVPYFPFSPQKKLGLRATAMTITNCNQFFHSICFAYLSVQISFGKCYVLITFLDHFNFNLP